MKLELDEKTEARFVGNASGLENAAYAYTDGTRRTAGMHVYAARNGKWICANKPLTAAQIADAEEEYELTLEHQQAERNRLLNQLLGPDGERILAERHGNRIDKDSAPTDLKMAAGFSAHSFANWLIVKYRLEQMRKGNPIDDRETQLWNGKATVAMSRELCDFADVPYGSTFSEARRVMSRRLEVARG